MIAINYHEMLIRLYIIDFVQKGRNVHCVVMLMIAEIKSRGNITQMSNNNESKLYQHLYAEILATF